MTQGDTTSRPGQETDERRSRLLIRLANMLGVETSYIGEHGDVHLVGDDVIAAVLAELGVRVSTLNSIEQAIVMIKESRLKQMIPPTVLCVAGQDHRLRIHTAILDPPTVSIILENGSPFGGTVAVDPPEQGPRIVPILGSFICDAILRIGADLPIGYHTIRMHAGGHTQEATLICAPEHITLPAQLQHGRLWGWSLQLYSVRSAQSWGVGDFEDLKTLLIGAKRTTGADFILLNPLHAGEPVSPLTPSPYLPVSRRFVNFTYIRPESIPEYRLMNTRDRDRVHALHEQVDPLNGDAQIIDRDAMWNAKRAALWLIFQIGRDASRQAQFDAFKTSDREALDTYAAWCVCYEVWGHPVHNSESWIHRLRRDSPEVQDLCERHAERVEFYRWLEWVAFEQLAAAQLAAKDAGMALGIISDMAAEERGMGREWSQSPVDPTALERTGYASYRAMVHTAFAHAGAVRIDHIVDLFRRWRVPRGNPQGNGTYIRCNSEIMLAVLVIEAQRAQAVAIGEDLGAVPEYVASALERHGILSSAAESLELQHGGFIEPQRWPPYAVASVNMHDMLPAAGYLNRAHMAQQTSLAPLVMEHDALMSMLGRQGFLDVSILMDERHHEQEIVEAMYRALASSPCKLLVASVTDGVGERRAQHQPGLRGKYPNWRIPLADGRGNVVPVESLFSNPRLLSLAGIMRRTTAG